MSCRSSSWRTLAVALVSSSATAAAAQPLHGAARSRHGHHSSSAATARSHEQLTCGLCPRKTRVPQQPQAGAHMAFTALWRSATSAGVRPPIDRGTCSTSRCNALLVRALHMRALHMMRRHSSRLPNTSAITNSKDSKMRTARLTQRACSYQQLSQCSSMAPVRACSYTKCTNQQHGAPARLDRPPSCTCRSGRGSPAACRTTHS